MEMPPPRPVFHQVGKNYFAGTKVFADAKMIILDANILISLKKWITEESGEAPLEIVHIMELIRSRVIHFNLSAVEASWPHETNAMKNVSDYRSPISEKINVFDSLLLNIAYLDDLRFQELCKGTFDKHLLLRNPEAKTKKPGIAEMSTTEYSQLILSTWASVMLLIQECRTRPPAIGPLDPKAKLRETVVEQVSAFKKWRRKMIGYGLPINEEISTVSQMVFFHGKLSGPDNTNVDATDLLKINKLSEYGILKLSRNIAFDFTLLAIGREFRNGVLNGQVKINPIPTSVLTGDKDLVALASNVTAEQFVPSGSGGRFVGTVALVHAWPQGDNLLEVYGEDIGREILHKNFRSPMDVPETQDLIPLFEKISREFH